jgi:micrococcal nuclease
MRRFAPVVALVLAAAVGYLLVAGIDNAAAATCADYDTQAEAQRAADTRDGDGDRRYCESLPRSSSGGVQLPPATRAEGGRGTVTRVIDGDTIAIDGKTVRLIGIDTPESVRPGAPVECGATAASRYMKRLATGKRVRWQTDDTQDTRDRYGRLLAYVSLADGRQLQRSILRAGWAKVYVYNGKPFQQVRSFRDAARAAQHADRGVWSHCGGDFHR